MRTYLRRFEIAAAEPGDCHVSSHSQTVATGISERNGLREPTLAVRDRMRRCVWGLKCRNIGVRKHREASARAQMRKLGINDAMRIPPAQAPGWCVLAAVRTSANTVTQTAHPRPAQAPGNTVQLTRPLAAPGPLALRPPRNLAVPARTRHYTPCRSSGQRTCPRLPDLGASGQGCALLATMSCESKSTCGSASQGPAQVLPGMWQCRTSH